MSENDAISGVALKSALDGLLDGEPPVGTLVDDAIHAGRRARRRRGLGAGAAVAALAIAATGTALLLATVGTPADGPAVPAASRSGTAISHVAPAGTTVTVSIGAACGGSGSPCRGGACVDSSCAYVHVRTAGFTSAYTCDVSTTFATGGTFDTQEFSGDIDRDTAAYFGAPGYPVTVVCHNATQRANGTIVWP